MSESCNLFVPMLHTMISIAMQNDKFPNLGPLMMEAFERDLSEWESASPS
jgi:hypothetical protein